MLHMLPRIVRLSVVIIVSFCLLMLLGRTVLATRDGEIAFESDHDGNWEIYLLDLATGTSHNLTRHPADDLDPAWSPDGSSLAFSADRDGDGQPELYVMGSNSSLTTRISTGGGGYRNPSWSPDGTSLTYMLGFGQIYKMDAVGGAEQWLGAGFLPSLSPDGTALLYSAESTSTIDADIYRVNLTDHRIADLTNNLANEWGARWSPDGARIVFSSLRGGKTNVYVMNADGSDTRAVTSENRNDLSPAWSPDGERIVYASEVDGMIQLYIIDVDGGEQQRITFGESNSHSPAWRPPPG